MTLMLAEIVLLSLATWRVSVALYYEYGPWDWFARLRTRAGVYDPDKGFWGKQLSCFWCCSFWAALIVLLLWVLCWPFVVVLALSGAVTILAKGGRIIWREMSDG